MKNFKIASLPLAIAGLMASNAAFAGTEGCFEVYKGANDLNIVSHGVAYVGASCIDEDDRVAATASDLAPTTEAAFAYELTGDLDVDFDALGGGADTDDLQIVYVPTTDIPSGTLITMELTGATFDGNADLIHLVQYDADAGDGSFVAVASTDGDVDGETSITFVTKGDDVPAGTRLALSRAATGTANDVDPIGINIENDGCTDPSSSQQVSIRTVSAVTDGGTGRSILGAATSNHIIADISPQFVTFVGSSTTEADVNAESTDHNGTAITARAEFVYEDNSLSVNALQVITPAGFVDRAALLDQSITLDADDHLETKFVATAAPGDDVEAGIYNGQITTTGVLDTQEPVETGTNFGTIAIDSADAVVYETEALDLFTPLTSGDGDADTETAPAAYAGANYNKTWYVLENTDADSVMNFNYMHTPEYTLNFDDADELDHCATSKTLHEVGVNGAVLKVPYTFDTTNNFIRITNEHSETAEITLDIFDESGNEQYSVDVGSVGEHASVVLRANELIDLAQAAGYTGTGDRHTMTFTVTAPKDSVHGVSVQAIPGGVDRVMPVLDQNDWSQ